MDKVKYASMAVNANYKSLVWMSVAALLLLSNLMLAGFVLTSDMSEKTIVLPAWVDQPFSVQGDQLSTSYVEQMARHFSHLLLTYHKQNVQYQFDTVLRYTDPAIYNEMKTRFAVDVERIQRNDIRSVFHPMKIHVKENTAHITGELNGFVGGHLVNTHVKTYELRFNYTSNLTLAAFNELIKNPAGSYDRVEQDEHFMIDQISSSDNRTESNVSGVADND